MIRGIRIQTDRYFILFFFFFSFSSLKSQFAPCRNPVDFTFLTIVKSNLLKKGIFSNDQVSIHFKIFKNLPNSFLLLFPSLSLSSFNSRPLSPQNNNGGR